MIGGKDQGSKRGIRKMAKKDKVSPLANKLFSRVLAFLFVELGSFVLTKHLKLCFDYVVRDRAVSLHPSITPNDPITDNLFSLSSPSFLNALFSPFHYFSTFPRISSSSCACSFPRPSINTTRPLLCYRTRRVHPDHFLPGMNPPVLFDIYI